MRRAFLVRLWPVFFVLTAADASWPRLPPIDGELAGKFSATAIPGAPPLDWKLRVRATGAGRRSAELSVAASGARLRAEADFDGVTGNGSWKIIESELEAAVWFSVLAPQFGSSLNGISAEGKMILSGNGVLQNGRPSGMVKLAWSDGALRNSVQGWSLDRVALDGAYEFDAAAMSVRSSGPLELTVRTITTKRFGARNVLINALLNENRTLSVSMARIEIAGGEITADPTTLPLSPPVLKLNLRIKNVGLQDIVALVPAALTDARGRIDGEVRVSWSEATGFQVGDGHLGLRNDEPTILRLASLPGFLTSHLPERFALLPAWTGPLARWFAPTNPAYAEMRDIEMGRAELQVQALDVQLTPEGDSQGRSAVVQLSARPARAGGSVKEVTFQINVSGPLAAVLKLGINQGMSVKLQ